MEPELLDQMLLDVLGTTALLGGALLWTLRAQRRRASLEVHLKAIVRAVPTPEDIRAAAEEQERVRWVLAVIQPRHAELLLLRSQDLSYDELASALDLNPASIGTLLSRAQQAFRKEYIKRYGDQ